MTKTAQEVYDEILSHIKKQGGAFQSWYCGVTENIQDRLHGAHKVPKEGHWYIYRKCENSIAA